MKNYMGHYMVITCLKSKKPPGLLVESRRILLSFGEGKGYLQPSTISLI